MMRLKQERLTTDRLELRPWCLDDAPALFELARDPHVGPRAGWQPHTSVEESRVVIQQVLAVPDSFAIVERATGALVGAVALKHEDDSYLVRGSDEAELGYWIGVPFQGRGYATEAAAEVLRYAFEDEGIHAVWAGYYDGNERSRRVQEKLGFVHQFSAERDVSLLGEHRIEHCQRLDAEAWHRAG